MKEAEKAFNIGKKTKLVINCHVFWDTLYINPFHQIIVNFQAAGKMIV